MDELETDTITETKENENLEDENLILEKSDLFNKNTKSFQCLAQIEISRSSLLRHPLYHFPELEDPELEKALYENEEIPTYDNIGCERYKDLCKDEGIIPFRRVLNALPGKILDLKYYALGPKATYTICKTMEYNDCIKHVTFQENWFKPEAVAHIAPMIKYNKTIVTLDLKNCQLGKLGAAKLKDCFQYTKSLTELDLSYNDLGDEGMQLLADGIRCNTSIVKLNLSHNSLSDGAQLALGPLLEDNYTIKDLDLSWNYFYSPTGMQVLMEALTENLTLTKLNLSWNGISEKDTFVPIFKYIRAETHLQHLDLSNNRISGILVKMLRSGLKSNESLITLNVGFNPLTPDDVEFIARAFFDSSAPLHTIDFGNTYVNKSFIPIQNRIRRKGCEVKYGGIFSDYKIKGPDIREVVLNRAKYIAMAQKKKKFRQDLGHFLLRQNYEEASKDEFGKTIKKNKIKLDKDLLESLLQTFAVRKKFVNLTEMRDIYMKLYPDTALPVEKKKKKGKGKGKKKK